MIDGFLSNQIVEEGKEKEMVWNTTGDVCGFNEHTQPQYGY